MQSLATKRNADWCGPVKPSEIISKEKGVTTTGANIAAGLGSRGHIGPDHWQAPRRGVKPYGRPAQGTVPVDWIGAGLNRA